MKLDKLEQPELLEHLESQVLQVLQEELVLQVLQAPTLYLLPALIYYVFGAGC